MALLINQEMATAGTETQLKVFTHALELYLIELSGSEESGGAMCWTCPAGGTALQF